MTRRTLGLIHCLLVGGVGYAQEAPIPEITAAISLPARTISTGKPVWISLTLQNISSQPVTLTVPGTEPTEPTEVGVGLPVCHVFSGKAYGGLKVTNEYDRSWQNPVGYQPPGKAPTVTLAPHSSVGVRFDAAEYYPSLKTPGRYRIHWAPYGGRVQSNTLMLEVAPLKQAEIETDFGSMNLRFFYEDAPEHVANFIELVKKGFYDNLTFHKVEAGYYILGGCPNGDGTGIRTDGKKLAAELNDRPVVKGTVVMGRLENDFDSASCQFFISNTSMPEIEGHYTVFGELYGADSLRTLDQLMAQPVDETGRPKKKLYIRTIRLSDVPVDRDELATDGRG